MAQQLAEDRRTQLDGIVSKMEANGETPDNIQFVVNDFKQKYATPSSSPTIPAQQVQPSILDRVTSGAKTVLGAAGLNSLSLENAKKFIAAGLDTSEGSPSGNPSVYDPGGLLGMAALGPAGATTKGVSMLEQLKGGPLVQGVSALRNIVNGATLKPAEQAAVEFAAKNNIPVRPSTATGNKVVAGTETATKHLPLFAGRGEALNQATNAALTSKAGELANATGGASSKEIAGSNVVSALQSRVEGLNKLADAAYDQARQAAAANVKDVQTGTQTKFVLENGGVVQKQMPVVESIQSPVDLTGVKKGLAPLLNELEAQIPEAQRQMSPGLAALRNVMNSADTVPLSKAIDDLSAIQNIARTDLPQLRSRAQGIAATVIKPLRSAVDSAAGEAGALDALNAGRELTRQKYEVGDLLSALKDKEPVRIVDALTSQRDRSISTLRDIAKAAPDSVKDIAGSTLSGIFDTATNEGTFKGAKAAADWAKLGDETKKILFTPDHLKDLDNFFTLARMEAKDFNPSGTAKVGALTAAGGLAIYNPIAAGASVIGADVLSRLLYKPDWAKLVVSAMKTPASGGAGRLIAKTLLNAAGQIQGQ